MMNDFGELAAPVVGRSIPGHRLTTESSMVV
jgi:hypothetical protein